MLQERPPRGLQIQTADTASLVLGTRRCTQCPLSPHSCGPHIRAAASPHFTDAARRDAGLSRCHTARKSPPRGPGPLHAALAPAEGAGSGKTWRHPEPVNKCWLCRSRSVHSPPRGTCSWAGPRPWYLWALLSQYLRRALILQSWPTGDPLGMRDGLC